MATLCNKRRGRRFGSTAHERHRDKHCQTPPSNSSSKLGDANARAHRALEPALMVMRGDLSRLHTQAVPLYAGSTQLLAPTLLRAARVSSGVGTAIPIAPLAIPRFRTFGVLRHRPQSHVATSRGGRRPRTLKNFGPMCRNFDCLNRDPIRTELTRPNGLAHTGRAPAAVSLTAGKLGPGRDARQFFTVRNEAVSCRFREARIRETIIRVLH